MVDTEGRPKEITIELETVLQLMSDSLLLQCLYDEGVDNWEGYDKAELRYEATKSNLINKLSKKYDNGNGKQ